MIFYVLLQALQDKKNAYKIGLNIFFVQPMINPKRVYLNYVFKNSLLAAFNAEAEKLLGKKQNQIPYSGWRYLSY